MLLMVAVPETPVTLGTPLKLQLVALVEDQVNVDAEPLLTVVGVAERERVGAAATTAPVYSYAPTSSAPDAVRA